MIYVYTSIASGFDNLRPPAVLAEGDGVKYICFTNVPMLPTVPPWEYRPLWVASPEEPWRTARVPKILPHLMLPGDAEYSIYHDGNFQLNYKPRSLLQILLGDHDWAAHQHPCRTCIYEEADVLLKEKIGTAESVQEEICRYRKAGYPERNGLWANGLIARRHTQDVAALNENWWAFYADGCERDQLSFPVARHALNFPVKTIRHSIYASPYLAFRWHAAWRDKDDNPSYHQQRDGLRDRIGRLEGLVGPSVGLKYSEH